MSNEPNVGPQRGQDLPDSEGLWVREEDEWAILVQQSNLRESRLNYAGFSRGQFRWGWIDNEEGGKLIRGNWTKATAPPADDLAARLEAAERENAVYRAIIEAATLESVDAASANSLRERICGLRDENAQLRREVAEAKAELERLRKERDEAVALSGVGRIGELERELASVHGVGD